MTSFNWWAIQYAMQYSVTDMQQIAAAEPKNAHKYFNRFYW